MLGRKPKLVNRRNNKVYDLSIGRDSRWGNRSILSDASNNLERDAVCDSHDIQLTHQILSGEVTIDDLLSLEGKTLGCWCVPKRCHGHNIIRRVVWARNLQNKIDKYLEKKRCSRKSKSRTCD